MRENPEKDPVFGLGQVVNNSCIEYPTSSGVPEHGTDESNDHLASIFKGKREQFATVLPFIRCGLERGERCLYVADNNPKKVVLDALSKTGIDVEYTLDSGQLSIHTKADTYLKSGAFEKEAMTQFWKDTLVQAGDQKGFEGIRAATEMTWALDEGIDLHHLVEYEAVLNDVFAGDDFVVLCQYDRNRFPSEVISDVIRTHPLVVHNGTVCHNVYSKSPSGFLNTAHPPLDIDRTLEKLTDSDGITNESPTSIGERKAFPEGVPTVLVVEDNHELADMYAEWLNEPIVVRTAYDGEAALTLMNDTIDVVILDRHLPEQSGDDVLTQLREKYDCRVAMVTVAEPDLDDLEMEFDDYLTKPVQQNELRTTVEHLLELDQIRFNYFTVIDFELLDRAYPILQLSDALECRIELLETIQVTGEGSQSVGLYRIHDDAPKQLFELKHSRDRLDEVQILNCSEDEYIAELVVSGDPIWTLARMRTIVESVDVDNGVARFTAVVPPSRDSNAIVDALCKEHPAIEITAIRNRAFIPSLLPRLGVQTLFSEHLTARQMQALELAYQEGYFERPRATSQEMLANAMEISQETFSQHLHEAQYRLFTALLGEE